MSLSDCVMKIEDLTSDEIAHELFVRNIQGLVSRREKTSALRKVLLLEGKSEVVPPCFPKGLLDVTTEFETCENKICELNGVLDKAYAARDKPAFAIATSRLVHLLGRLERLVVCFDKNVSFREARDCVRGTLLNIDKVRTVKVPVPEDVLVDFNLEGSPDALDKSIRVVPPSFSVEKAPGVDQEEETVNTGAVSKALTPGKLTSRVDKLTKSFQSMLNFKPSANTTELAKAKTPEKTYSSKPKRTENSLNHFVEDFDLSEILPLDRQKSRVASKDRVSVGYARSNVDRWEAEVQGRLPTGTREALRGEWKEFGNRPMPGFENFDRCGPNARVHGSQRYPQLSRNPEHLHGRFIGQEPGFNRVQEEDEESRYQRYLYDREQYRLNDYYAELDNARREQCFDYDRGQPAYPIRDRFHDEQRCGYPEVNRYQVRVPIRDGLHGGRRSRNTIPINQWNIKFSGEDGGLSLSEFLGEVELFAESEQFTSRELFSSAVHLFSGFARKWFKANYSQLSSWEELVHALKQEFQPEYYDYLLLAEIDSRLQGKEENFSSFYAEMVILFGKLNTPLSEHHKLFLLKKNMVKGYALAIATMQIDSLRQLAVVCKRLDSAKQIQDQQQLITVSGSGRFVEPAYRTPVAQFYKKPFRQQVNEIEGNDNISEEDVCEFKHRAQKPRYQNVHRNENNQVDNGQFPCYNCGKIGHLFRRCPEELGRFCFLCGFKDVTILSCPRCKINQSKEPSAL